MVTLFFSEYSQISIKANQKIIHLNMNERVSNLEKNDSKSESDNSGYSFLSHSGIRCNNCKKTVDSRYELCPNCGSRLHSNHCTFCGAPMKKDDLFCGECGGDVRGIQCPSCGTLCFRSFCSNCNQAVDELGQDELMKAQNDPVFIKIRRLAEDIAKHLNSTPADQTPEFSPEIQALIDRYRLLSESTSIKSDKIETSASIKEVHPSETSNKNKGIKLSDSGAVDLNSAVAELNSLLESMKPDPRQTPQMQRNYFSARKVAVYRKSIIKEPVEWVCNLCGCHHRTPSECARPELGGRWIYKNKEVTTKSYE